MTHPAAAYAGRDQHLVRLQKARDDAQAKLIQARNALERLRSHTPPPCRQTLAQREKTLARLQRRAANAHAALDAHQATLAKATRREQVAKAIVEREAELRATRALMGAPRKT